MGENTIANLLRLNIQQFLKNSLVDYRDSDDGAPQRQQTIVKHHVVSKQINENIGAEKTKYKKKKKSRRCINDILTEVGEKE